ncbi:pyridoxal-phosphate-dependent aminotransferase family protein [Limnoglobus roseus]|uniref:Alanine--glyoxylate aminotransferase family protein n=1 Tax=Limnoglobus roseus TaxID=2598579 RepID=A0A5C1ABB3_9BACT|nr:alanine--glyoxylate aminotransferase family protein [Limnoglobus roseus]QEL15306.1 alanine--glyoxylate aminotransferase family protein [Limnoglobus roseus]
MKTRLFTPGPTPVPEETLLELAKPVGYHRSAEAKAILAELTEDLKYVFQTTNTVVTITSSGTGGMDAAVSSSLAAGEKVILLTAGRWGERWRGILKAYGTNIVTVEVPYGKAVTPEMLESALKANPDAKAVFATLSETSTGVGHDLEAFGKLTSKTDALLIVDAISGLGAMECHTDKWNLDIVVTGSQKALMLPPGLAFVSVNDKAWKKIEANPVRNFYLDLRRYKKSIAESDTPFTPANTLIKAQRASLKRIRAEGIENLWARHAKMGNAARAAVKAMGLELFAERPNNGLTVITVPNGVDGSATLKAMEKKYGFKLADGQDNMKGKIWRLSHMGYTDAFEVLGAIAALELVLIEGGHKIEPGVGVAAFQKAFAAK